MIVGLERICTAIQIIANCYLFNKLFNRHNAIITLFLYVVHFFLIKYKLFLFLFFLIHKHLLTQPIVLSKKERKIMFIVFELTSEQAFVRNISS